MSLNNLAINSHLNSIVLAFALNRQIDFRVRRSPEYLAYLLRRQPIDWYTVDVGNNVICLIPTFSAGEPLRTSVTLIEPLSGATTTPMPP